MLDFTFCSPMPQRTSKRICTMTFLQRKLAGQELAGSLLSPQDAEASKFTIEDNLLTFI